MKVARRCRDLSRSFGRVLLIYDVRYLLKARRPLDPAGRRWFRGRDALRRRRSSTETARRRRLRCRSSQGMPVRRFTSRKGQRHLSGLWWSATTGGHVGFESWLETRHVLASGFRPVRGRYRIPAVLAVTGPMLRASHSRMRRDSPPAGADGLRRWSSTAGRWSAAGRVTWRSSTRRRGPARWPGGSIGCWVRGRWKLRSRSRRRPALISSRRSRAGSRRRPARGGRGGQDGARIGAGQPTARAARRTRPGRPGRSR